MKSVMLFVQIKNVKTTDCRIMVISRFAANMVKIKTKYLLYCRTCGKRFASTRATAFFGLHLSDEKIEQIIHHATEGVGVRATARLLGINKDTVNRVILRAGEHCELILSSLLRSLKLKETQLDELWCFVKKRNVLTNKSLAKSGSGQPSTRRQD